MKKLMSFALMAASVLGLSLSAAPQAEAHAACRITPHVNAHVTVTTQPGYRYGAPVRYYAPPRRAYVPTAEVYIGAPAYSSAAYNTGVYYEDGYYGDYYGQDVWVRGHYNRWGRWIPGHYERRY